MFIIRARTDLLGCGAMFRFALILFFSFFFFFNLIWFPLLWRGTERRSVCQVKFRLIIWGLEGGGGERRSREVHAVFLKSSQSTWQLPQIFPFCPWYLDGLWLSLLFVRVCLCVRAQQIPLSCLPRPGLVRRGERLHLSLPSRVQSLVSRPLLRAHVHPLHPGEMDKKKTKKKQGRWKSSREHFFRLTKSRLLENSAHFTHLLASLEEHGCICEKGRI